MLCKAVDIMTPVERCYQTCRMKSGNVAPLRPTSLATRVAGHLSPSVGIPDFSYLLSSLWKLIFYPRALIMTMMHHFFPIIVNFLMSHGVPRFLSPKQNVNPKPKAALSVYLQSFRICPSIIKQSFDSFLNGAT